MTALSRCLVAAVGSAALAGAAAAQSVAPGFEVPRTASGHPDLQGIWSNSSVTDMERLEGFPNLVLTPEEAAAMEGRDYYVNRIAEDAEKNDAAELVLLDGSDLRSGGGYNAFWVDPGTRVAMVRGELRSSWITDPADGKIPFSEDGRRLRAEARGGSGRGGFDGPETRPLGERCLIGFGGTGGPPMRNVLYNNHYQIVQTPDHVMILIEMVHDARIIPIFETAEAARAGRRPAAIKPWLGDSVGWWEGDALVVETVNVHPLQRGSSTFLTEDGKVTERFERYSQDQIVYSFTVEDPAVYTQPWSGEIALNLAHEHLYEYACHEGNYAMPGILTGARLSEAEGGSAGTVADDEG
jgi:hypothetical protein